VKKYMATLGDSTQIIVGAAQLFVSRGGSLKFIDGTDPAEYSFDGAAGDDIQISLQAQSTLIH
jgi:hypothetical protein